MSLQHNRALPHGVGCRECFVMRRCNECGDILASSWDCCTNGRCMPCHKGICGTGLEHTPYRLEHEDIRKKLYASID